MYVVFTNVENRVYSCRNDTLPCIGITLNKAEFNTSGSYFRIPFKDIQLKRRLKGVRCLFTNGQSISTYSEDVLFIAKAEGVKCLNAKVIDNNTNITVECMTSKIYPLATCTFDVPGQISYSHVNYSDTVEYYQSNCTWTSALQNFQAGNNLLNVYFYPNVTRAIHFATSLTTTFHFNVSNIFLSKECFNGPNIIDGYIRPGATAICVCYLDNIGYPPASLEWSNGSHLNEGTNLNSTATALTIEPFSQERMYTCTRSTHLLKDESSISYVVKYAKGPTACSVEFKDKTQTVWKMCTNAKINWTVICQVNQTDAIPGIKGKININSIYSNVLNSQNMSTMYQVRNEFNVTEAGTYSIGCLVQNLHFNDVYATCSYIPVLQVIAPPKTSPILQFKSTSVEYQMGLQENKVYTVECTAFGGIPSVSNITVSCGNIKELTQSGNILTSPVTFTRTMTGQNCTCTAQHITGCYENNTSTLQLNILCEFIIKSFQSK
ncbi:vascular cell adhesion protein 1 [Biomphalaria glabrata]